MALSRRSRAMANNNVRRIGRACERSKESRRTAKALSSRESPSASAAASATASSRWSRNFATNSSDLAGSARKIAAKHSPGPPARPRSALSAAAAARRPKARRLRRPEWPRYARRSGSSRQRHDFLQRFRVIRLRQAHCAQRADFGGGIHRTAPCRLHLHVLTMARRKTAGGHARVCTSAFRIWIFASQRLSLDSGLTMKRSKAAHSSGAIRRPAIRRRCARLWRPPDSFWLSRCWRLRRGLRARAADGGVRQGDRAVLQAGELCGPQTDCNAAAWTSAAAGVLPHITANLKC